MKNNGTNCKKCKSDDLICVRQYSDEDGKIITIWECLNCREIFKTKW